MYLPTKTILAATLAIAGLAATAQSSSAITLSPVAAGAASLVQDVRWGCGPGWHPNPWGRCVPNARPVYGYGYAYRGYGYHPHYWGRPYYRPYGWHHGY